ncbi:MAG: DUF4177 domain-containing protein, partial [Cellvibrionaceae bacterium]|nr:DUF4177 domain-containing protein [Cellvibrionaceae bacterium]
YFNLPTTTTRMRCEGFAEAKRPTFTQLYSAGWRLVQIVAVDGRLATKQNTAPSPMVFFERLEKPAQEKTSKSKKKKSKKK